MSRKARPSALLRPPVGRVTWAALCLTSNFGFLHAPARRVPQIASHQTLQQQLPLPVPATNITTSPQPDVTTNATAPSILASPPSNISQASPLASTSVPSAPPLTLPLASANATTPNATVAQPGPPLNSTTDPDIARLAYGPKLPPLVPPANLPARTDPNLYPSDSPLEATAPEGAEKDDYDASPAPETAPDELTPNPTEDPFTGPPTQPLPADPSMQPPSPNQTPFSTADTASTDEPLPLPPPSIIAQVPPRLKKRLSTAAIAGIIITCCLALMIAVLAYASFRRHRHFLRKKQPKSPLHIDIADSGDLESSPSIATGRAPYVSPAEHHPKLSPFGTSFQSYTTSESVPYHRASSPPFFANDPSSSYNTKLSAKSSPPPPANRYSSEASPRGLPSPGRRSVTRSVTSATWRGGCPSPEVPHEAGSTIFMQPSEYGVDDGLFYAAGGPAVMLPEMQSAGSDLAAQAEEHLTVHAARHVTVVPGSRSPRGDTFLRTLTETEGSGNVIAPLDLLEQQLDWLDVSRDGLVFARYRLEGRKGRRRGGQGIVAFACDANTPSRKFAIKLYCSSSAFMREREAITNKKLKAAMPACHAIVDQVTPIHDGPLAGSLLPPMIITERGESLSDYVRRSHPDFITSMQVIIQIAKKLQVMHKAGFCHRDLKPGNCIWLPSQNAWSLIDFGCTAACGVEVGLSFSLLYAAPETVQAFTRGKSMVTADTSADIFAFGIMCFELFTRRPFYKRGLAGKEVGEMLAGFKRLPHEQMSPDTERKLGTLKKPILKMLHRDPGMRPSICDLLQKCQQVFGVGAADFE